MPADNKDSPVWIDDPNAAPTARTRLPVVVVGAGPVGLAAAAHLLDRGLEPLVLEAGPQVGTGIAQWRHVRLFSPWCLALDPVSVRMLEQTGWIRPDLDALPTGGDLLDHYLKPLAGIPALSSRTRLRSTVLAVARDGVDKVRSPGRERLPFIVRIRDQLGDLHDLQARAVIDASGTWNQPNPLGASGLPALGEPEANSHIVYGLPDVLGCDRARYVGRRVVVVGAGHSAATSLLALAGLQHQDTRTEITWVIRSARPRPLVGKGSAQADELPARGQLATDLAAQVDTGHIQLVSGFRIHTVETAHDRICLVGDQLREGNLRPVRSLRVESDEVIAATGFRPDHSIATELRLALEPALESPAALGPLIDPNVHTCGTVPVHGIAELAHPEAGYVIVGMKSYGRAPTFLLATGYHQIRSVAAVLAGDRAGAALPGHEPSATSLCAINRDLQATARRRHQVGAPVPDLSAGISATGSAADWSAATCCSTL